MKLLLPLAAVLIGFSSLAAQEPAPGALKAAEKLAEVIDLKNQMSSGFEAMLPMINNLSAQLKLAPADKSELEGIFRAWFSEDFDHGKIMTATIKLYATTFTEEELNGLVEFYNSPLGRKSLKAMPELMKEGAKLGMAEGQAKQDLLKARLEPFFKKHAPKGPGNP